MVLQVQKDLRQGLRDMYEHAKDKPLMIFVDPKRYHSSSESLAAAPVGHSNLFAAVRDVLFEEKMFRPDKDLVVVFDGRCSKTSGFIKDLLKKAVKSKLIGQRGAPALRLLHHNGEVNLRRKRTVCSPCSVDPLETCYLIMGKERMQELPLRHRRYVDMPGTNEVRGFSNLSLRSSASLELNKVTKEIKDEIFGHISSASTGTEMADQGEQQQRATAPGSDEEEEEPRQQYVTLVQWEHPEELFAEFFHLYSSEGDVIGDLTAGSGVACLAAARAGRRYYGIVNCPVHATLVRETVGVSVM